MVAETNYIQKLLDIVSIEIYYTKISFPKSKNNVVLDENTWL